MIGSSVLSRKITLGKLQSQPRPTEKYGLLSYDTTNLGDDIQSLAALNLLPRVDCLILRDSLAEPDIDPQSAQPVKIIMNGWFMGRHSWPPHSRMLPLFTSFHISQWRYDEYNADPSSWMLNDESIHYLKAHEPIGCRDLSTLQLLIDRGVECYFSGCLTLTLSRPTLTCTRREILFVDTSADVEALYDSVPPNLKRHVSVLTPQTEIRRPAMLRFQLAMELLKRYSEARLVITSRLHCALPCLAFGTPVIFTPVTSSPERLAGLSQFLNSVKVVDDRVAERIPWEHPEANPEKHLPLVQQLKKRVSDFIGTTA